MHNPNKVPECANCACSTPASTKATPADPWFRQVAVLVFLFSGALWIAGALLEKWSPQTSYTVPYLAAALVGGYPLARNSFPAFLKGHFFTIDFLMIVACVGAFAIKAPAEGAAILALYSLGQAIEDLASRKSRKSIAALQLLQPENALLLEKNGMREVSAALLAPGNVIVIRTGDVIAADGNIIFGKGFVDESQLTGESKPVCRDLGHKVFAGTISLDGTFHVEVTETSNENRLARIIRIVQNSQASRVPLARTIDSFARYYTPSIFALAILVATLPPFLGLGTFQMWVYRALGLLLIGCPCALVLSTPTTTAAAIATAAKKGVLIKGGQPLESLGRVSAVALDKTGTLTTGTPLIQEIVVAAGHTETQLLQKLSALEANSTHPFAAAICKAASKLGPNPHQVTQVRTLPGIGIEGVLNNQPFAILAVRAAALHTKIPEHISTRLSQWELEGMSSFIALEDNVAIGAIAMTDSLRDEAKESVQKLKGLKVHCEILTGDTLHAAKSIAKDLQIHINANLSPEEKLSRIDTLKNQHVVAMIGDGINDGPALARAHIGVAMGGGTGLALATAEVTLANNSLLGIVHAINISRRAMSNIKQNIAIAIALKGAFLITSILGVTSLWMAVLADTGAAVLVTLNALRILQPRSNRD